MTYISTKFNQWKINQKSFFTSFFENNKLKIDLSFIFHSFSLFFSFIYRISSFCCSFYDLWSIPSPPPPPAGADCSVHPGELQHANGGPERLRQGQSTYFTVRGQSYFYRLPKYWTPIPLSARRVCTPRLCCGGGGTDSTGGEGDGGSIFWKMIEIGLPSYSKICTLWRQGQPHRPRLHQQHRHPPPGGQRLQGYNYNCMAYQNLFDWLLVCLYLYCRGSE